MKSTHVPFVDLLAQYEGIKDVVNTAIEDVIESGWFVLGPKVQAFERAYAKYCDANFCIALNSGTAALQLALLACEIGPGDEVITVPHTFVATVASILHTGAKPIFIDIDTSDYCIDINQIEDRITNQTKAIVPVHIYGKSANMDAILDIACKHGLLVIEDACQAHGAEYKAKKVGVLGVAGCFSFYPGKNLGAFGEGGAVITNDPNIAHKVSLLRDHGSEKKYEHVLVGFNYRMTAIQGAVLGAKLPYLDQWIRSRREIAKWYDELLSNADVLLPEITDDRSHVYHLYVVQTMDRDSLQSFLQEKDISTGIHYPTPVHLQPGFEFLGHSKGDLPVTEYIASRILSLPMYPELTFEQVERVASAIREWRLSGR